VLSSICLVLSKHVVFHSFFGGIPHLMTRGWMNESSFSDLWHKTIKERWF
jgi:hypothetical protein